MGDMSYPAELSLTLGDEGGSGSGGGGIDLLSLSPAASIDNCGRETESSCSWFPGSTGGAVPGTEGGSGGGNGGCGGGLGLLSLSSAASIDNCGGGTEVSCSWFPGSTGGAVLLQLS